jgi:hypothetical protein
MFDFGKHQVCVVTGPANSYVLIAIRPERRGADDATTETLLWDDGDHQRAFEVGEVLEDVSSRFRFRDTRGRVFALEPMTPDAYAARVRPETNGPKLGTHGAVQQFFLQPRAW